MMRIYNITPVPKPRMTRRDKWLKPPRPCVVRYRAFEKECQHRGITVDNGDHITFVLPMPKSWSKKKRAEFYGKPHQQTPDVDNLCKAILDSCYKDDSHIYDLRITKVWGNDGEIQIERMGITLP